MIKINFGKIYRMKQTSPDSGQKILTYLFTVPTRAPITINVTLLKINISSFNMFQLSLNQPQGALLLIFKSVTL